MNLYWKAFLAVFGGVAMILCSSILPVMYVVDIGILKLHDAQWFVQFAIAFVLVSALIAGLSIASMEGDKDKRLIKLLLMVHSGQQMMLYGNPIGIPIWLWRKLSII